MSSIAKRRDFLKATTGAVAAAALPIPAAVAAGQRTPALSRLRTAHVGVGGMGASDLASLASHASVEVAALCDVDRRNLDSAKAEYPDARGFVDFREMLSELGDSVDAVVVSTPDHTHAAAAMLALQLGKRVYCQKPLTHDVQESRRLREVAEQSQLTTQMGIQVHSAAPYRQAVQMVQSGVVGPVSRVLAWSNKNWGFDGTLPPAGQSPPKHLEWDLWLGTAPERPYLAGRYHPGQWRKILDFGVGTLGDMGVHIFDTPYAALELTAPNWVKTECRPPTRHGLPESNKVTYQFPGTRHTSDTLEWTWYDGALAPPPVEDTGLPTGARLPGQGALFVGEEGMLLLPHVGGAKLFPEENFKDYRPPKVAGGNHYHEWVDACLTGGQTSASFSYGGLLTEALLLGVIAGRFPGKQLQWDAAALRFKNLADANALLRRDYRQGFQVDGL
ncbi:MAG: Gfo/Idh/MocA family oxidoreductase [Planctomycetota bacterium]